MKRTVLALMILAASSSAAATLVCSNVTYGGLLTEIQSWTVGQTKPKFTSQLDVVVCSADGDELFYIKTKFTGLPMTLKGHSAVVWRGDTALFILDNL